MIVDLLRNDLSKNCKPGSIKTPSLFAIESFPAVHHLVSTVIGKLQPDRTALSLFNGAFPGGSITGAPKIRAMQIIEELEPHRRSIYCGSMGYFSQHGRSDTSITIRTLLAENDHLYCWAGGGLVADSTAADEYQETKDKVSRILPVVNFMTINTRADFIRRFSLYPSPPVERRIDEPLRKRLRPAAVLIPIVERTHGLSLILTRRSSKLRKHAGQISFPGGRFDETDSDLLDTALRETEEEIGLPRSQVEVIGRLHDYPVLSYFMIRPYVAFVSPQQPLVAEESEVAEIFEVPLADILDHGNHYVYRIRKFIYDRVYFIPWQHRNIWGATAGILRELSEQLQPDGKNHFRPLN